MQGRNLEEKALRRGACGSRLSLQRRHTATRCPLDCRLITSTWPHVQHSPIHCVQRPRCYAFTPGPALHHQMTISLPPDGQHMATRAALTHSLCAAPTLLRTCTGTGLLPETQPDEAHWASGGGQLRRHRQTAGRMPMLRLSATAGDNHTSTARSARRCRAGTSNKRRSDVGHAAAASPCSAATPPPDDH